MTSGYIWNVVPSWPCVCTANLWLLGVQWRPWLEPCQSVWDSFSSRGSNPHIQSQEPLSPGSRQTNQEEAHLGKLGVLAVRRDVGRCLATSPWGCFSTNTHRFIWFSRHGLQPWPYPTGTKTMTSYTWGFSLCCKSLYKASPSLQREAYTLS